MGHLGVILKYAKKLRSREEISGNTGIPWDYDLINTFKRGWNWHWLVSNESVKWTEKMMVDFDVFDMNLSQVSTPGLWTEEFIFKYKDKFNWAWLCYNPHLPWTESFIDTLSPLWNRFENVKDGDETVHKYVDENGKDSDREGLDLLMEQANVSSYYKDDSEQGEENKKGKANTPSKKDKKFYKKIKKL